MAGWSCNHPMAQVPRSIVRNPLFSFEALDTGHRTRLNGCRKRPISTWTDVKARCRRRQASARGRVGSFKVSSRAPRVLVSTSPPLSGGGWSTSQRTNARTTNSRHGWLATPTPKTYQHLRKLAVQRLARWELPAAVPQHGPSLPVPHPPCPHLSAEKHPFREMQDTCIDSHATDEPRGGFVFGLPCFVDSDWDSTKDRTHKGNSGHSTPSRTEEREGIPTPISSCWQAGRSGRDGVMLQGAPVSTHLVGLSDRAWFLCRHQ